MPLTFAYYCSGHGYGHATRVSAFASHLLSLEHDAKVIIHIVSSAPAHVFQDSIARGALYRNALIDPVVVQPVAYLVDREKSVEALRDFLESKDERVQEEADWLRSVRADCVLSDAAFLAFLAADRARIPSVLITNFTFDSVFSYLSHPVRQGSPYLSSPSNLPHANGTDNELTDCPIPEATLAPLVAQIYDGYRRADLLLRLPGHIPIPSFALKPPLPAPSWIDPRTRTFSERITAQLYEDALHIPVHSSIPFSPTSSSPLAKPLPRTVRAAPLLVRAPSSDVYTPAGRARVLSAVGVPPELHDARKTRVLVVSFGGQVFTVPNSRSRTPSRPSSFVPSPEVTRPPSTAPDVADSSPPPPVPVTQLNGLGISFSGSLHRSLSALASREAERRPRKRHVPPVFSPSHIYIPGAPAPASLPPSPISPRVSAFSPHTTPLRPVVVHSPSDQLLALDGDSEAHMLPDDSWIAIVCGGAGQAEGELPPGFFVAPRDVYMPDLMAVADVLLGKLGYGAVSECVDSCTPFVYVSRPLFVEEHGLQLYLSRAGIGVEMPHAACEAGDWATCVADAWARGGAKKLARREGVGAVDRAAEGREMARFLVGWVDEWMARAREEVVQS